MRRAGLGALWLLASVATASSGAAEPEVAASPGPPASEPAPSGEPAEPAQGAEQDAERYTALVDSLAAILDDGATAGQDEAALAEADALAGVAEELFVEGEIDLAASLMQDAIALFAPEGTP
ncbi:MAG: hypothetical protein DHS20C21_04220 [Gemmatimonadota bacterium]|nr:MAG: hypothetical protein DHS20C21_04220 [Gemmatimonadota bacterium]